MREDLINKLQPFVENFVDSLLKVNSDFEQKLKDLERDIFETKKISEELRLQKIENNHQVNIEKDKLSEKILKQIDLNNEINDELVKYNKLNSEINQKISKINENLKSSEIERELTFKKLESSKKIEEQYTIKLDLLKNDENINQKIKSELDERQKQINVREKIQNKKDEEQAVKQYQQNDSDLRLKAREKEVIRLIKRNQLEKIIGNS